MKSERLIASLALACLVAMLGLLLLRGAGERDLSEGWMAGLARGLVNASYDSLHAMAGAQSGALTRSPVVIVYLDLPAYQGAGRDPALPWPREVHAQLLRKLTGAGAKAVVFDIVFAKAGPDAAADQTLASAIRENGRVILAGEYNNKATQVTDETHEGAKLGSLTPPYEPILRGAATWGMATQIIDDDFGVRRYLAGFPSHGDATLTWATATWLGLAAARDRTMDEANRRWLRYYGPALAIPHVEYGQALDPAGVPAGFFRDKIVFIGARPMAEFFHERQDEFRSPFHSWLYKDLFMPGVEVHATELLNLLRGDWLRRGTAGEEALVLVMAAVVFGGGLIFLRPIPAALVALAGTGATLGLAALGFSRGLWFPWLIVAGVQIPAALGASVLFQSVDWLRARRRFEAARRAAEAKIREQAALIEKAHDAILVQDLDGGVIYANPSAERLYGWSLAELQQVGAARLLEPDASTAAAARVAAVEQGEWNGELRQQTRQGRIVIVASRWTLIRDDVGRPKALLSMNSDITEQKQLEAQFLQTQRLNTIGTLAGGMAHDLNNALAPILMGVQLLRRKTADAEAHRLLGLMEASTHRGADMVRQVLHFARGREAEVERLELGPLLNELEKLVRETFPASITVESFLPPDLWPVRGNPTQIHQVLLNLCVNARDAMPAGGRLSLAADNVTLRPSDIAGVPAASPGAYVSLLVSDSGLGMTPEVRARIFEPFYTTKSEGSGTGIGLATVQRIVKAHGGFVRVESEPGQGTTFEVFLPRAAAVDATAIPAALESPRGHGECVLLAEDEQAIRDLVVEGLTGHGYQVIAAADGAEALRLFSKCRGEVRLLLTDTAMPVLDGPQTIAAVRELSPGLPVIVAGGEPAAAPVASPPVPADVSLLRKPFTLEELLSAVASALRVAAVPPAGTGHPQAPPPASARNGLGKG